MFKEPVNLFLLHHAGGSKYAYQPFTGLFPPGMKVNLLELPGRGARMNEPLVEDIHLLVEDVYRKISPALDAPYVFMGHSMGSVLAYLLTRKSIMDNRRLPVHLFLSGRTGPCYFEDSALRRSSLPRKEFAAVLRDLGGVPAEVLDDDQAMDFFEPVIRSDFKVLETYSYTPAPPLDIPVTVLLGKEDHSAHKEGVPWQDITTLPVDVRYFDGGHFFLMDKAAEIARLVATQTWNSFQQQIA
ncbi:thioesterase [Chitinophaga oryzae]|uniref:Thioesterase n=1 Tax=Chitinophaga oryzae TaxID=2725414 RepID=A0AAE7D6D2_9BACT|nr:alpha/beta fold hydrolase [Chitinophaga oryzae]QJB31605.1 thioesterase [Chitinophaga oryzae]